MSYWHAQIDLDGVESIDQAWVIQKQYHFYISDDKEHDTHFVEHCFKTFFEYLKNQGIKMEKKLYGHMDVHHNLNQLNHSMHYVDIIDTLIYHTFGVFLRVDMERVSMMMQELVSNVL